MMTDAQRRWFFANHPQGPMGARVATEAGAQRVEEARQQYKKVVNSEYASPRERADAIANARESFNQTQTDAHVEGMRAINGRQSQGPAASTKSQEHYKTVMEHLQQPNAVMVVQSYTKPLMYSKAHANMIKASSKPDADGLLIQNGKKWSFVHASNVRLHKMVTK